jgi:D-glycero-D-manno-heptose 1,7-bisphosphate phosphatase
MRNDPTRQNARRARRPVAPLPARGPYPLDTEGNWSQLLERPRFDTPRPALFVDRDGVIAEEVGYLHRVEDLRIIEGAGHALAALRAEGWILVVVTNQSGVGRGMYGWTEFDDVQSAILAALAEAGASPHMVLACPFHPKGDGSYRHPHHPWRKPAPGMILAAARALPIDLERSWIVGDNSRDIKAGRAAGLAGAVHVLTGHGASYRASALDESVDGYRVIPVDSIADAPRALALEHKPDQARVGLRPFHKNHKSP